jgi:hypothetical protein
MWSHSTPMGLSYTTPKTNKQTNTQTTTGEVPLHVIKTYEGLAVDWTKSAATCPSRFTPGERAPVAY